MWLIQAETLRAMEEARATGVDESRVTAFFRDDDGEAPYARIMRKAGDQADINVRGVLTRERNILAMLFGGGNTTYGDLVGALADADADPKIRRINLNIDTPGGAVDGLYDALASISATSTPVTARIDKAASAGFILATAADEMVANNPTASIGSFGVAVEGFVDEGRVSITNTGSPDKRPDLETEDGQNVVREYLDQLHSIFEEEVAANRGIEQANLTTRFGSGAMFVASEALSRGMIDRIEQSERPTSRAGTPSQPTANTTRKTSMDLETLKAEHPDTYRAALQAGATQERDRVTAHITMGESSGDMQTAVEAIREGSEMTATLQARYMAAGMRKGAMDDRQAESDKAAGAAAAAAEGAGDTGDGKDHSDRVADALTSQEVI